MLQSKAHKEFAYSVVDKKIGVTMDCIFKSNYFHLLTFLDQCSGMCVGQLTIVWLVGKNCLFIGMEKLHVEPNQSQDQRM